MPNDHDTLLPHAAPAGASAREHAAGSDPAFDAELMRELLGTTAHDLGGLSSALALHAQVLASAPSSTQAGLRALDTIGHELRELGRQLRQLRDADIREADTAGLLAPATDGSLRAWFDLVHRFGRTLPGRGIALRGEIDDVPFPAAHARTLAWIMLALLRDLRGRLAAPGTVTITAEADAQHGFVVRLRAQSTGGAPPSTGDRAWRQYAMRRAAHAGWHMDVGGDDVRIRIPSA